jgi:uncharacterized protein YjbI with pentapeptide repeats
MANPEHLKILLRGADEWNQWREKLVQFCPDLSDANLSSTNLEYANLSSANLRGAYLINANLRGANLEYADLRSADLFDSNLFNAYLRYANLGRANLRCADLRSANLSGTDLRSANLSGTDLRSNYLGDADLSGANLSNANLSGADLSGINLSNANLTNADLSNANLPRTQALGTNFQGAILTGACIEDWHINSNTQLEDIVCDYVYQKYRQQERRPYSGNFQPGDFTRFYQRAIETFDLIFQDGIDWKSFAVTLQTLNTARKLNIEGENNQLSVRAIEKWDDGSFVIRVDVPKSIDKAEIEAEFKQKYEIQLIAQAEQYRQQIQAKDLDIEWHRQQNTNLTNAIVTLASKPITLNNHFMPTNESKGNTYNQSNMGIGHVSGGELKDNKIAGTIYEAPNPSLAHAAAEIRDLLTELEKSYPTTTTIEQMTIATEAIKRIEANPDQKKRIVNALKSGGVSAFEKVLDNPLGAFMKGALEGWEKEA